MTSTDRRCWLCSQGAEAGRLLADPDGSGRRTHQVCLRRRWLEKTLAAAPRPLNEETRAYLARQLDLRGLR